MTASAHTAGWRKHLALLVLALILLPIITCYAAGAVVLAVFFNNTFTWEPGRLVERAWHDAALAGDRNARWLLLRNDLRWLALLILSGSFFWMAR